MEIPDMVRDLVVSMVGGCCAATTTMLLIVALAAWLRLRDSRRK